MEGITLVIGNKNYSSWSLRPWLLLKQAGIPFREHRISLYEPGTREQLREFSPSGKVPALIDGDLKVWESLAICEYIAEHFPDRQLWPANPKARAVARSVAAEMHAGFAEVRKHMTFNARKHLPGKGRTPSVLKEIDRIGDIWNECRAYYGSGGPFLFGRFSVADAMYAPMALRFLTYAVPLDAISATYVETIATLRAVQEWIAAGRAETETIPALEPYA
jgi:glutathione S-transferase